MEGGREGGSEGGEIENMGDSLWRERNDWEAPFGVEGVEEGGGEGEEGQGGLGEPPPCSTPAPSPVVVVGEEAGGERVMRHTESGDRWMLTMTVLAECILDSSSASCRRRASTSTGGAGALIPPLPPPLTTPSPLPLPLPLSLSQPPLAATPPPLLFLTFSLNNL